MFYSRSVDSSTWSKAVIRTIKEGGLVGGQRPQKTKMAAYLRCIDGSLYKEKHDWGMIKKGGV